MKPVYWVTLKKWMNLTIEEHRRLDQYCRNMGMELGIDIVGDRAKVAEVTHAQRLGSVHLRQWWDDELQKDHDESKETGGGPGA